METQIKAQVKAVKDPRLVIDVDTLPAEGWSFHDVIPAERVTALLNAHKDTELEALTPMDVDLKAYRVSEGLRIEGTTSVHLSRPCGRCTQPAPLTVAMKVGQTLFPAVKPPPPRKDEEAAPPRGKRGKRRNKPEESVDFTAAWDVEDVDTGTFEDGEVDVEAILREQTLLEVPFTHVCREDCKGLCQACGADLNRGPCGCAAPMGDPRLAALANIKLH